MSKQTPQLKKNTLSTQGYKGTRDFFPSEQRLKSYLYSKIHKLMVSYGYEEYAGPFVEHLELYAAKSSEEIVKDQLYSFKDKGDRTLAIRPEMTPTLARMVATKQRELIKPIRWYSIPTCMRYERPQRGRLREFDQLNVDIFGGNPLDEDIEIVLTGIDILKSIGASYQDFVVKINHRGIINSFLTKILAIDLENIPPILRLFDKKDKLSAENFQIQCKNLNLSDENIHKINSFMNSSIEECIQLLGEYSAEAKELKLRIDALKELTSSECILYSPDIMRGFDYYTGMVFEFFDRHPSNQRALFGGGRYDNLVGAFGGDELPGVGYGAGDVALINFMEVHGYLPVLNKQTDICVLRFSEQDRMSALKLTQILREKGLNIEAPVSVSKFGKQIQYAEKIGAKAVVFQGEEEIKSQTFSVKWLKTGLQENYELNDNEINNFIKKSALI
ncbi:histidine--tRNA ligase [Pigmentibacter sp. JX0631]|uniref:histidine--tRNA ligase n=1 Tax=Pigmentibacter sp. JX0631 TaxID=2976982 RepID=UPI002468964A|nr:histidine--tRNA ligase [Pigmentibacter sp. JX0631]WGL60229.1 histidine--tRNA ligase [Pigmentibacter sp. JX0631]